MEYIKNEAWEDFYGETDPAKRRELLDSIEKSTPDDGANALRRQLFTDRHKPPKNAVREVDNGIWYMIVVPSNLKLQYRLTPGTKKEILKSMRELGALDVDRADPVQVSAVYWEIRNVAKRYFTTCNGPKYARKYFGIMQSSDEEKLKKTAEDVWACAVGVPVHYRLTDEMLIFSDAVRDAFFDFYDDGEAVYKRVAAEKGQP